MISLRASLIRLPRVVLVLLGLIYAAVGGFASAEGQPTVALQADLTVSADGRQLGDLRFSQDFVYRAAAQMIRERGYGIAPSLEESTTKMVIRVSVTTAQNYCCGQQAGFAAAVSVALYLDSDTARGRMRAAIGNTFGLVAYGGEHGFAVRNMREGLVANIRRQVSDIIG